MNFLIVKNMKLIYLNNIMSDIENNEIKYKLIDIINMKIEENNWNQTTAAKILGVDQPKISQLKNNKISGFSLQKLLSFLKKLDCEITMIVEEKNNGKCKL